MATLFGIHLAPPKTEELNSTIAYLESIYKNCFKPNGPVYVFEEDRFVVWYYKHNGMLIPVLACHWCSGVARFQRLLGHLVGVAMCYHKVNFDPGFETA